MLNIRNYAENAEKELFRCAMEKGGTYEEVYEEFKRLKSEEGRHFERMLSEISTLQNGIEGYKSSVKNGMERYDKLKNFKLSEIGEMIADFCREPTDEKLAAIQEKAETESEFEIMIRLCYLFDDEEDNGEVAYDPHGSCFVLKQPYHWYNFDNFNIDDDLQSIDRWIKRDSNNLAEAKKELKDIKEKIGDIDFEWLMENIDKYFAYGRRR